MTRPIDEKIVAMKMDNSDFKKKAVETTGLFGKLTKSLNKIPGINLGKTAGEMKDISRAADNVKLNGLNNSVKEVSQSFTTLQIMATTALVNITNRAVNAGINVAKSFSTDQMGAGFRQYEGKMNAIMTILSNTEWEGTTLKDTTGALANLNKYAVKTVYNFGQMTTNIGRFTAAGVKLKDSVAAIKGLGNLAAISGSSSEQLNSAMYQMSQALASGRLTLMDWNSLVNAGMAGKKTQDALVQTARDMGKNVDMANGFRDSIQQGWLTSEVLLETLKKFGKNKSMIAAATNVRTFSQMMDNIREDVATSWATTWELVFGDFNESKILWSGLANIIGTPFMQMGKRRNDFLRAIIAGDGLKNMIEGIVNLGKPVVQVFKSIGHGLRLAFPPTSPDFINKLMASFNNLAKSLVLSQGTVDKLTTISKGFFSIFSSVWEITKALTHALYGLLPSFKGLGSGALSLLASFANLLISFNIAIKSGKVFHDVMYGLMTVIAYVGKGVSYLGDGLKYIGSIISGPFKNNVSSANDELKSMTVTIAPISDFFKGLFSKIGKGFNWLKEKTIEVGSAIKKMLPNRTQVFAGGFMAGLVAITGIATKMAWDLRKVFTGWGKIGEGFSETLESASSALNSFSLSIKANALLKISIAVGVLAASFWAISGLNGSQIAHGLYMIVGSLTALVGALAIMSKYDISGTGMKASIQIIALSTSFAILSGALKKVSNLKWEEIQKGMVGLIGVMGTFTAAMVLMSKFSKGKIGASSIQMLAIAAAIHILFSAIEKISKINVDILKKGLKYLGIILLELGVFLRLAGNTSFGIGAALGVLATARALTTITSAVKDMGSIDVNVLKQGLVTIGEILASVAAFAAITGKTGLFSASAGLLLVSGALLALTAPISILGNMNIDNLTRGLEAMAAALVAIGAASLLMKGMVTTGAGLILVAGALNLLVVPIAALGAMSWQTLLTGIGGLALALAAIAGVSLLLSPAVIPMLGFGAAIGAMGVAMLAAGAGMALFSTGLVALAGMTAGAITTIVATLTTLIAGLTSLIPTAVDFISKIIMKINEEMGKNAPKIAETIGNIIVALVNVVNSKAPIMFDSFLKMVLGFAKAWKNNLPLIVGTVIDTITATLTAIADREKEYIDAGVLIITNFIEGIGNSIDKVQKSATDVIFKLIESMTESIRTNGPKLTDEVLALVGEILLVMIDGGTKVVNALFGWMPGVKSATSKLGSAAEKYIKENFGAEGLAKDKGAEFADALKGTSDKTNKAATNVATAAENGLKSTDSNDAGMNFGLGFVKGIEGTVDKVKHAATNIASTSAYAIRKFLGINSPAKMTIGYGKNTGEGYAIGMDSTKDMVVNTAHSLAGVVENMLGIRSSVPKEAEKGGKKASESLAKGMKSNKHKVAKSARSLASKASEEFRKRMNDVKYKFDMGEINYDQYIAEIEKLKKSYSEYPEIVKKANLKIKQLEDQAARHREQLRQKEYSDAKQVIDDEKYYHELSLTEELQSWEKIQAKYDEGTKERKKADKEVYRLKNDLNRKLIDLNDKYTSKIKEANKKLLEDEKRLKDEYDSKVQNENKKLHDDELKLKEDYNSKVDQANRELHDKEISLKDDYLRKVKDTNDNLISEENRLTDKYNNALENRTRSLTNFAGIFDKVQTKNVSGKQLVDNLKGQVDTFKNWSSNIQELSIKGIDKGLLAKLRDMGPKAAGEIDALNKLTKEQLTKYSDLWKTKNELAHKQALGELEGLKTDTQKKIEQLKAETADKLEQYKNEWVSNTKQIRAQTAVEIEKYKNDWLTKTDQLRAQTAVKLEQYKKEWQDKVKELKEQTAKQLEQYKEEWISKVEEISKGTKDKFVSLSDSMENIGSNTIKGMMKGMDSMKGPLLDQAKTIADSVSSTISKALDIGSSSSKVTKKLGESTGKGLGLGIASGKESVKEKTKGLTAASKDSLNKFLNGYKFPKGNNKIDKVGPVIGIVPDTSLTTGLATATKSSLNQNGNNSSKDATSNSNADNANQTIITQNLTFNNRDLTPSEVARKNLQASRQLASEWGA